MSAETLFRAWFDGLDFDSSADPFSAYVAGWDAAGGEPEGRTEGWRVAGCVSRHPRDNFMTGFAAAHELTVAA